MRVPLHWRLFVEPGDAGDGGGADRFEGQGWYLLDRLVQWCREADLRVIIDLHAAPGGQTGVNHDDGTGFPLTFYVPRYRRLTVALWRALAAHYRDEPAILGYDLLNEPISPYSDETYLNPRLEPLYREIVAAIRSVDTNHVVLLAGAQWSTNFAVFSRPFDANAVYTYHKFWAKPTRDALQSYLNFSKRWNVPLLIGETGEYNNAWNKSFRELHEKFGIGWVFWPYKSLDSETAVVSIAKPDGWDLIADVPAAPTTRCSAGRVAAARAGAGDPQRLSAGGQIRERPHQRRVSQFARACRALERDPEKWKPAFRKNHTPRKIMTRKKPAPDLTRGAGFPSLGQLFCSVWMSAIGRPGHTHRHHVGSVRPLADMAPQ